VRQELADHEAHDEGNEEAACAGEGESEQPLDNGLAGMILEFAIVRHRSVHPAEGQPQVKQKEEGQRYERYERPVVARTEGEELGENDHHEHRDEYEAGARPFVIAVGWGLLGHVRDFQVSRKRGRPKAADPGSI